MRSAQEWSAAVPFESVAAVATDAAGAAIVGNDPGLRAVLARASRVAPTRIPVLIQGESGTGKELLARLVHLRGPTPAGPFIAVNCGTLPRELADSELFGHERGAFTGAGGRKAGWFEEAHGGTLVLDEVGELPFDLQSKLLRVLETGRLRRVGGSGEVAVGVRVVALTLRDLRAEVERGAFRVDLYHRLAGFELTLPPLRARRDDIPLLVERFLLDAAAEVGPVTIDADAVAALMRHGWPGNVRELRNILWRAVILGGRHISAAALELPATGSFPPPEPPPQREPPRLRAVAGSATHDDPCVLRLPGTPPATVEPADTLHLTGKTFDQIERAVIDWALRRNGGVRRRAARALAMPRSTFCDKAKRHGMP
ncbi:MAG: sigma-54 dependent transcriptional regulator [Bacteroidota bacterium]